MSVIFFKFNVGIWEIPIFWFGESERRFFLYSFLACLLSVNDDVLSYLLWSSKSTFLKFFLGQWKNKLSYVSMGTSPEGSHTRFKRRAEEQRLDTLESGKEYLSLQSPQGHVYKILSELEKHSPNRNQESPFFPLILQAVTAFE